MQNNRFSRYVRVGCLAIVFLLGLPMQAKDYVYTFSSAGNGTFFDVTGAPNGWTYTTTGDVSIDQNGGADFFLREGASLTMTSSRNYTGKLEKIFLPISKSSEELVITAYSGEDKLGTLSYGSVDGAIGYMLTGFTSVITIDNKPISLEFKGPETAEGTTSSATISGPGPLTISIDEPTLYPSEEDEEITFDAEDFAGADLSNTSINGILYTLNVSQDGEGFDGSGEEGVICLVTTLTDTSVGQVASHVANNDYQPGDAGYAADFSGGITMMVPTGSGIIKIDAETTTGYALHVKIGNNTPVEVASTTRDVLEVPYTVTEDTYVYVYLVAVAPSAGTRVGKRDTAYGRIFSICRSAAPPKPTKVTIEISEAAKTTYVGDYNLDFTGSDLAAYVVTGYEKSDGTIWLTRVYDVPAGTPIYLKGAQGSYDVDISDASTSYYQNLMLGNNSSESLTVTSDATDQYYNVTASGFNIINGSKSIGSHKCYLRLPTTLPAAKAGSGQSVKITSAGKTTLCSDVDLDFSGLTNVKAYTATGYDKSDGTIWMTRVERASAGTPLYIKGDEGTWTIPSSAQQTYYANMLKGNNSDASLTINATDGEYTNHFLAASGFSTFEGTKAVGAHKSYLQILTSYLTPKSGARGMSEGFVIGEREGEVIALTLGAGDGETTGIKAVGEYKGDAEVIYNLNGQRVENPGKGLYIINGQKVVMK